MLLNQCFTEIFYYIPTGSLQGLAKENIEDKSIGIVDVIMTK